MLERNTANGNAGDGIHVDELPTTVTANTANDNGGFGIWVPGAIDGGGDGASGNGSGDCVGVVCG